MDSELFINLPESFLINSFDSEYIVCDEIDFYAGFFSIDLLKFAANIFLTNSLSPVTTVWTSESTEPTCGLRSYSKSTCVQLSAAIFPAVWLWDSWVKSLVWVFVDTSSLSISLCIDEFIDVKLLTWRFSATFIVYVMLSTVRLATAIWLRMLAVLSVYLSLMLSE